MPSRLPPPPLFPSTTPLPLFPQPTYRPPPPSTPPPQHHHNLTRHLPAIIATAASLSVVLLLLLLVFLRRRRYSLPRLSSYKPAALHRFSYSAIRRTTSSFSPSRRLGQGGFGAVYSAILDIKGNAKIHAAVKLMDSGPLQGEREFHNEILMASKLVGSDRVVKLLGFATDHRRRRMCLVYELMENGNLQECLLQKKPEQLMDWGNRFQVALDVSRALAYLHHQCDPAIIHGDVKPSNVLLDANFRAKIADFGLARFKLVDHHGDLAQPELVKGSNVKKRDALESNANVDDIGSMGETESMATTMGYDDTSISIGVDRSPEVNLAGAAASPEMVATMNSPVDGRGDEKEVMGNSGEENGVLSSWKAKDYVMEWIGSEVKKERPNSGWIGGPSSSSSKSTGIGKTEKKKVKKKLEWWVSMDDEKGPKKEKRKTVRDWWKEEHAEELERNKKKKKEMPLSDGDQDNWWATDDDTYRERQRSRSRRIRNRSSIDWWLDGLGGGDPGKAGVTSYDSAASGEIQIPKSGGFSSSPSMRGTICYIAPEYGAGGDLSDKCDVYSFGVLLLVLIAGRRPLQVTSPVSEYQSANLISWARRLARKGKLLHLIDKKIHSLNTEQAQLCIMVALACLHKSPRCRPSMEQVVGMLTGELEPPVPPTKFSSSPPSRLPFKSQKHWQ
ncbi:hypothetical protein Dimus_000375 [Dionaea muscipula]